VTTLYVTGKLAEPALRRVLADRADAIVAPLKITVAALMTTDWVGRQLTVPAGVGKVVLPGLCRGELEPLTNHYGIPVERGPADLRDLPEYLGGQSTPVTLDAHDIEIVAEINHAPRLSLDEIRQTAAELRRDGADFIDVGCEPGFVWAGLGDCVRMLVEDGFRVSVDSMNPQEIATGLRAGATLVLSVNSTNRERIGDWLAISPHAEFVVIPDEPSDLASLGVTVDHVTHAGARIRIDPILEPIGFGFAASLGRYLECRRRFPKAELFMGIGNLTELTDCDSAGLNVMLAGFCQEVGIRGVLTTQVINWARSSVTEFAVARRLVYHAVTNRVLPKRLDPSLIMLRDPRIFEQGEAALRELASRLTDPNYRIFAEGGEIHIMNGQRYLHGREPFELFDRVLKADPTIDASHAFYLGYEFAKAVTALTLSKQYTQDRALNWGVLTVPEASPRDRHRS
jgi:dihydropteroate synthase-like protein